jgi:MraZ protein
VVKIKEFSLNFNLKWLTNFKEMFIGEYHRTKDNKGRVFIPSKFREELIGGAVISKGFDERCLFLFSKEGWNNLRSKIQADEAIDPQGRVKIPQNLSEYANLDKDIVLVGVSDRVEIWSKQAWSSYYDETDNKFMSDDSTLEELGF